MSWEQNKQITSKQMIIGMAHLEGSQKIPSTPVKDKEISCC